MDVCFGGQIEMYFTGVSVLGYFYREHSSVESLPHYLVSTEEWRGKPTIRLVTYGASSRSYMQNLLISLGSPPHLSLHPFKQNVIDI